MYKVRIMSPDMTSHSIKRGRNIASSISQTKERFEGSIKTGNEPIVFNNDSITP